MSGLLYQKPPQEILDLVDVSLAPMVQIDNQAKNMILFQRDLYKSLEELSEKELKLAGLRINPKTNISSAIRYVTGFTLEKTDGSSVTPVTGLPEKPRLAHFSSSPDEKQLAFTNTTENGVELWIVEIETGVATRLTTDTLNANLGRPFRWFRDSSSLLVRFVPLDKKPLLEDIVVPKGPVVSENEDGVKAQNRTYQNLLKNPKDEKNFEQLVRSELYQVTIKGEKKHWKSAAMHRGISFSPDGEYLLISELKRPFSYLVPYSRFPFSVSIYNKKGELVKDFLDVPLMEELPKGFMAVRKGIRSVSWRTDHAATLYWTEALDEGDPENEVEYRDEVYQLTAPFNGEKKLLLRTKDRFHGINWGTENIAIAYDAWWSTRNARAYLFNPSDTQTPPQQIFSYNFQDRYNFPGEFVLKKNKWGRLGLVIDANSFYLIGDGFSEKGKRPFIDKMNIDSFEKQRLWEASSETVLEEIVDFVDVEKGLLLTRIESPSSYPNYYFRNIKKQELTAITNFNNPFLSLKNIHKEVVKYKREDGVELSATLYLPANYDFDKKEKLPLVMWAYPQEFTDKDNAGQVTTDPLEFTYPYYGSPIYWVRRGYAILDDVAFPIIGENEEQPNDTYIPQLVANAKAAIDYLDEKGYIDRKRVAIGGHSYGAFMTANLLTHSDLFAAGIARSGAYNRTLTPFGFQSEERHYWEVPEVYYNMSPFSHANKMKTPLLLIHGETDSNSGTYPMQSKRYFNALKGLGATVRLVILPNENHGYAAKESILHVLWEQDRWLDMYVKNKIES